jgi:hypothetical protein
VLAGTLVPKEIEPLGARRGADAHDRCVCRSTDRCAVQRLLLLANATDAFATCTDRLNETIFAPQAIDTYFTKILASITTDRHTT